MFVNLHIKYKIFYEKSHHNYTVLCYVFWEMNSHALLLIFFY